MTRRGFTLLELLLASALTVLLMVGILSVIGSLGSSAVADTRGEGGDVSRTDMPDWMDLLRDDVTHADEMAPGESSLTIYGHAGLSDADRSTTHRPVKIEYRVEQIAGRRWLVRYETALDEMTNRNVRRDLVAGDVGGFALTQRVVVVDSPGGDGLSPEAHAVDDAGNTSMADGLDEGLFSFRPYVEQWSHYVKYKGRYYPTWIRPEHLLASAKQEADEAEISDEQRQAMLDPAGDGTLRTVVRLRVWPVGESEQVEDHLIAVR